MIIEHNIISNQKTKKRSKKVSVDIFPVAEKLYTELDNIGLIERLKSIKQLGTINVTKNLEKSRYDYVILQLYLHQIIRKNIPKRLKYAYSNRVRVKEFLPECSLSNKEIKEITLADLLQLLIFAYNIGHFYNTFVASRAVDILAASDDDFKWNLLNSFKDYRCKDIANHVLETRNYQRTHLINSLLVLEKCDGENISVKVAKELLLSYLNSASLPFNSKLHYVFELFRKVRTVAYVAYDLNVAGVPFLLDLSNEKALISFFDEYLAEYNNTTSAERLMQALTKLLSDDVYNDLDSTICMTQISRRMVKDYYDTKHIDDYYIEHWDNIDSVFNRKYPQRHDYKPNYLKITFSSLHRELAEKVYNILEKTNNIQVGYYLRSTGDMTLAISIKKSCKDNIHAAFIVLKKITPYLRQMSTDPSSDVYILPVKHFLYYLFNEHNLILREAKDERTCTICTRGKKARVTALEPFLTLGSKDDQHEIKAMINYLEADTQNDVAITIPGSTLVLSNESSQTVAEFDGIIIYPNRKEKQIVLIEAKNMIYNPSYARNCLEDKFKNLNIDYNADQFIVRDHDAYYEITIK